MSEFSFIEQSPSQGAEHAVESGTTIGREGCDITLADPDVSRRHAAIQIAAGVLSIEDLGSTNGTLVNGVVITARKILSDGDEVRIGSSIWKLRAPAQVTKLRETTPAPPPASQATTQRPAAAPEPATAEAPAAESARPATPAPPAPKPAAPEPRAPEPAREAAPAARSAPSLRGDVPQPDFKPSGIRRIVPVDVPTAFTPETQAGRKGSAATRAGATAMATVVVALTTAGVVLYYITEPFK